MRSTNSIDNNNNSKNKKKTRIIFTVCLYNIVLKMMILGSQVAVAMAMTL